MERTFSRQSQNYPAGTFGPFAVDGFTSADTAGLAWTLTVENWPVDAVPAVTVVAEWSDGTIGRTTYNGHATAPGGARATEVRGYTNVPHVADIDGKPHKADVASGTMTVTTHVPLRTAVTFAAVNAAA